MTGLELSVSTIYMPVLSCSEIHSAENADYN